MFVRLPLNLKIIHFGDVQKYQKDIALQAPVPNFNCLSTSGLLSQIYKRWLAPGTIPVVPALPLLLSVSQASSAEHLERPYTSILEAEACICPACSCLAPLVGPQTLGRCWFPYRSVFELCWASLDLHHEQERPAARGPPPTRTYGDMGSDPRLLFLLSSLVCSFCCSLSPGIRC